MSEERRVRYEKEEEKEEEKQEEKQEEKIQEKGEEKDWDEKWHRDPLGSTIWAAILIWAGAVLLGKYTGFLDGIGVNEWGLVFLGAGAFVGLQIAIRLLVPTYRRPVGGILILAAVLLGVGLGFVTSQWNLVWALVLIAIGLNILLRGLLRRR